MGDSIPGIDFGSLGDTFKQGYEALENAVRDIGSWVGISAKTEILTDVQLTSIITRGVAEKNARKAAIRESGGNSTTYNSGYKGFQRKYKTTYSKQFFANAGYAPDSTAVTKVLDEVEILNYIQTIDTLATSIRATAIKYITPEEAAYDWMEDNIGWNNELREAIISGKTYNELVVTDQGTTIDMDLRWDKDETIIASLDVYLYDSVANTVEIDTLLYDVPAFDYTDQGGFYRTTVTQQADPTITVNIDATIEAVLYQLDGTVNNNQKLYVKYDRGGTNWYYYTEESTTIPGTLFTESVIDITPIIPLKELGVVQDLEGRKLDRMLNKLGVSGAQFTDALQNTSIDSAYIALGVDPDSQSHAQMKVLYNMFDLITNGSTNITISMSALNITYAFTVTEVAIDGSIGPKGTYTNTNALNTNSDPDDDTLVKTLQYQATDTQYRQITIEGFSMTYEISGQRVYGFIGYQSDAMRFIIPIDVMNNLRYKEWVEVYETSLHMISYVTQEVKYKWYESFVFRSILVIVTFVLIVISILFPPAWALTAGTAALLTIGVAITAINIAIAAAIVMIIAGAIIGMVIGYLVEFMVDNWGLDPAIAGILIIAVTIATANVSGISMGSNQYLALANTAMDATTEQYSAEIIELQDASEEYILEKDKETKWIQDQLEAFSASNTTINMDLVYNKGPREKALMFVDSRLEIFDFQYLYDIDYVYNKKKTVPSQ